MSTRRSLADHRPRHAIGGNERRLKPRFEGLEARTLLASLPSGFTESVVASGINRPTAMEIAPDGRIFIAQQDGNLRVVKDGVLLSTPFVSLGVDSRGERGLLGIAFDPAFSSNQYVYVYYTVPGSPAHNRVSRFTAQGSVALAGSEVPILELDNLGTATNHNGGSIHFGPDGKLYVAVGENANAANAQSLSNLLGKMLRINSDGSIPADNPYFSATSGKNRAIWAIGLRNPFHFAFQSGSGRMFINDVGQSTWEEIDEGIAGSNYGWPTTEGPTNDSRFRGPLYAYDHNNGIAITGGAFYNPAIQLFPAVYAGEYFFTDLLGGWIRRYDPSSGDVVTFATQLPDNMVALDVDGAGHLYYLAGAGSASGMLSQISYSPTPPGQPPSIVGQPTSVTVAAGRPATFSVTASGSGFLTYQWQRNGTAIPGAIGRTYTIPEVQPADNGAAFSVTVSNANGSVPSAAATLTVRISQPPIPNILSPTPGVVFSGGQVITFGGSATDPEDGVLPASSLTWAVDLFTSTGSQSVVSRTSGITSGSFTVPVQAGPTPDSFYRITLVAADSDGLSRTTSVDVYPRVVNLGLSTGSLSTPLVLDGRPLATPGIVTVVAGTVHSLDAISSLIVAGNIYQFMGWSDGETSPTRSVSPGGDATYTAIYNFIGIVPPVTVGQIRIDQKSGSVRRINLTFNGDVDSASARNRKSYWLILPGRDRRLGTRDDQRIRFRSVAYAASTNTATLIPVSRPSIRQRFGILAPASGTGLMVRDVYGRPIDGNSDGQPGGNFSYSFLPRPSLSRAGKPLVVIRRSTAQPRRVKGP